MSDLKMPAAFAVVGFLLGASVDALDVIDKVGQLCCSPPQDAPEMVAGYFAIPLDNIHDFEGEAASQSPRAHLFEVLSGFRMIETAIYQDAVEDAYAFTEAVSDSGAKAWATIFDEDRIINGYPDFGVGRSRARGWT